MAYFPSLINQVVSFQHGTVVMPPIKSFRCKPITSRRLGSSKQPLTIGGVTFEDAAIKERWQRYFSNLLNGEGMEDSQSRERECGVRSADPRECGLISKVEIREVMRKMPNGKAEGPDEIPVEVWKCLGEEGLKWLTELFNVIFRTVKMPEE